MDAGHIMYSLYTVHTVEVYSDSDVKGKHLKTEPIVFENMCLTCVVDFV